MNRKINIKYILLLLCSFCVTYTFGQNTKLGYGFEGMDLSSLVVATNLNEGYAAFDEMIPILMNEIKKDISSTSGFNSPDTLFEIIRVDTCKTCIGYDYEKYVINLSRGLSIDQYRKLLQYTKRLSILHKHYISNNLYGSFLIEESRVIDRRYRNEKLNKNDADKLRGFLDEICVSQVEYGRMLFFEWDYYKKNFITDAVCEKVRFQLRNPKYPAYYLEQFMEDNKQRWNPALVDTVGIPQQYFKYVQIETYSYGKNKEQVYRVMPNQPTDSVYKKYYPVILNFAVYSIKGNKLGVSPKEALYHEVENEYFFKGFKEFRPVINYVIETKDIRLLSAVKEFIKKYPEYKLTEKQRAFFDKNYPQSRKSVTCGITCSAVNI